MTLVPDTPTAYPIWRHGDRVIDSLGRAGIVEGRKGDRVLVFWGHDRGQTFRGWVLAGSLRELEVVR